MLHDSHDIPHCIWDDGFAQAGHSAERPESLIESCEIRDTEKENTGRMNPLQLNHDFVDW